MMMGWAILFTPPQFLIHTSFSAHSQIPFRFILGKFFFVRKILGCEDGLTQDTIPKSNAVISSQTQHPQGFEVSAEDAQLEINYNSNNNLVQADCDEVHSTNKAGTRS